MAIDVTHAGINFLDVMERRGDAGYVRAWPHIPGREAAGTVREVGAGVEALTVDQRVAAFVPGGGLAEVAVARAALTVPVPDQVPLPVAAAAPLMLATALLLLTDAARLGPGESVLVHSASGGVGGAVAQLIPVPGGGLRIGTVGRAGKVQSARNSGYEVALTPWSPWTQERQRAESRSTPAETQVHASGASLPGETSNVWSGERARRHAWCGSKEAHEPPRCMDRPVSGAITEPRPGDIVTDGARDHSRNQPPLWTAVCRRVCRRDCRRDTAAATVDRAGQFRPSTWRSRRGVGPGRGAGGGRHGPLRNGPNWRQLSFGEPVRIAAGP